MEQYEEPVMAEAVLEVPHDSSSIAKRTNAVAADVDAVIALLRTCSDESVKKNLFGETLYPYIEQRYPNDAGKITGMILDMDCDFLEGLIQHSKEVDALADEAALLLRLPQSE
jgi:hypothetical protein